MVYFPLHLLLCTLLDGTDMSDCCLTPTPPFCLLCRGENKLISQLIRYARASSNYSDFLKRHLHLRNRLLDQGYKKIRLIRSLKKFIFRYQYLVEIYSVSAEKIISDAFSYSENV